MTKTPELAARADAIYEDAGFRCCTKPEFALWYQGAQDVYAVGGNRCTPGFDPGSAIQFCLECHPLAQAEMAAQGRCVRLDMGDPGARERMRRWRERQVHARRTVHTL